MASYPVIRAWVQKHHNDSEALADRIERAIKRLSRRLRQEYGIENFQDKYLRNILSSAKWTCSTLETICSISAICESTSMDILSEFDVKESDILRLTDYRSFPFYALFFHLTNGQDRLTDDDINLYVADSLYRYAREEVWKASPEDENETRVIERLFEEVENLISTSYQDPFCRAYQTYLLGAIEFRRGIMVKEKWLKEGSVDESVHEKSTEHYKKAIRLLEESLYFGKIPGAASDLKIAYKGCLTGKLSPEEKEQVTAKFERFKESYPEEA